MGCGPSIAGTNVQPALAECHYTLSHADSPRVILSNESAVGPTSSCPSGRSVRVRHGQSDRATPRWAVRTFVRACRPARPELSARGPRAPPGPPDARTERIPHAGSRPSESVPDPLGLAQAGQVTQPRGPLHISHEIQLGRSRPTPEYGPVGSARHVPEPPRSAPHVAPHTSGLLSHVWSPSPPRQRRTHSRLSPLLTPSIPDSFDGNRPVVHGTPSGSPWCSALGPEACCLPGCTSSPFSSPHAVHT